MALTLPYPPSMNHYWRRVGPQTLISREGRTFRRNVCALLAGGPRRPLAGRLAVVLNAFPPDRRRRDLDNLQKPTLDAMQHAGVYEDDSQIDLLVTRRCNPVADGRLVVEVAELPLHCCPLCGGPVDEVQDAQTEIHIPASSQQP